MKLGMPDQKLSQEEIAAEVAKRQAANRAQFIKDKHKERQRDLASKTVGKRVHDIIELEDANGDDVFVWIYADLRHREVQPGEHCVVMILNLEQNRNSIVFDEVMFKDGRYWAGEEIFIVKVQQCNYTYL
jgi:hypothetical protein